MGFYQMQAAHSIWFMTHDSNVEPPSPLGEEQFHGSFDDATQHIAGLLADPDSFRSVLEALEQFAEQYRSDHSVMRFRNHDPLRVLDDVKLLQNTPLVYSKAR